jgi:predicted nucleic acid-binding protein
MPDQLPVFVDTAYLLALSNLRDQWRPQAEHWEWRMSASRRPLVSTAYVLTEVADALASPRTRQLATSLIHVLLNSPLVEVIPASSTLLQAALVLYAQRPDKYWSLTDCTSFVAMGQRGMGEALTADQHFRQAGFRALLLERPS